MSSFTLCQISAYEFNHWGMVKLFNYISTSSTKNESMKDKL